MELYGMKHQLQNGWTLWYLDRTTDKPWEECLTEVGSFTTVEDFWRLFNHIKPPSLVRFGCDYSLFKKGIRPMWEDKANQYGGRWLINLEKNTPLRQLDDHWLDIAMCMIGEWFDGHSDLIFGATISLRRSGHKIAVWLREANNTDGQVIQIGLNIKELLGFGPTQIVRFQAHRDVQRKNEADPDKFIYYI